jgi:hypothetical protein
VSKNRAPPFRKTRINLLKMAEDSPIPQNHALLAPGASSSLPCQKLENKKQQKKKPLA